MESAKVSSAYEGKRSRKRTAGEKEASRKAGRARGYAWKPYWNALCLALPKSTMMTRSMDKTKQGGPAGKKVAAEQPVVSANATMERWKGETDWWEEWPLYWTYEEQWLWWSPEGVWPEVGGGLHWEVPMSGNFGCVEGDDGEEPWCDDIWNFRGKN